MTPTSPQLFPDHTRGADFSDCGKYRYRLWRYLGLKNEYAALFIGLNPSTADEVQDDRTVSREMEFTRSWDLGLYMKVNIFAYRATDPKDMLAQADPVGEDNDTFIVAEALAAKKIVVCWGRHGTHRDRAAHVLKLLSGFKIYCFGKNGDGTPTHPLYLPADRKLVEYRA